MAAMERPAAKPRPVYLDLTAIRLPLPAFVSILHRATGAALFLFGIPFVLWVVQRALGSPDAWAATRATLALPVSKLVLIGLAWGYFYHFLAGLRHLAMDLHVGGDLPSARRSAAIVLVLSLLVALAFAVVLW